MKKTYTVKRLPQLDWDAVPAVELTHTGWLPECDIAATAQLCVVGEDLWVKLEAVEKNIRATLGGVLDAICTDSCLEFFFAPCTDDERYFNLEYNPLAALYLGFGGKRPTRVRQIAKDPIGTFCPKPYRTESGWGITYRIPQSFVQNYFPGYTFAGEAAGNFYKCGDKTETLHYLAWSPLTCDTPDYHRREDFGTLVFE